MSINTITNVNAKEHISPSDVILTKEIIGHDSQEACMCIIYLFILEEREKCYTYLLCLDNQMKYNVTGVLSFDVVSTYNIKKCQVIISITLHRKDCKDLKKQ